MEHVEFTYTAGMDEDAVEERLRRTETGVLALADGDDAYAVPLAVHYDGGDSLLLRLGRDADSEKFAFVETTERACFVVYDYGSPRDSWSVLVTGELHPVAPTDDRYDDAAVNRAFPDLRVFDEDVAELDVELYELRIETATGRETLDG
jgi:nitroimidazol reductase NimA-like FMN-containing flavoprotein (pyridoxamine 5'-phosphate oxidase superfamily)